MFLSPVLSRWCGISSISELSWTALQHQLNHCGRAYSIRASIEATDAIHIHRPPCSKLGRFWILASIDVQQTKEPYVLSIDGWSVVPWLPVRPSPTVNLESGVIGVRLYNVRGAPACLFYIYSGKRRSYSNARSALIAEHTSLEMSLGERLFPFKTSWRGKICNGKCRGVKK